jgi:hypothetical protein
MGRAVTKNKSNFDYRAIKKALSKYFKFSFKTPHKSKDFTPQQKAAITRKYLKVLPYIDGNFNANKDEVTFLKYPKGQKLAGVDGVRTDTGLFYKWPQAELKKSKLQKNKWLVVVNPKIQRGAKLMQKRRDVYFPFPPSVLHDIRRIREYVEKLKEKYRPHDIMWAIKEKRERVIYDPELFDLYFSNAFLKESDDEILDSDEYAEMDTVERGDIWKRRKMRKKHEDTPDYYIGVFFVYYLN